MTNRSRHLTSGYQQQRNDNKQQWQVDAESITLRRLSVFDYTIEYLTCQLALKGWVYLRFWGALFRKQERERVAAAAFKRAHAPASGSAPSLQYTQKG